VNIQTFINSRFSLVAVMTLARILPPKAGLLFADGISGVISRGKSSEIVRTVRANQWVAHDQNVGGKELDAIVDAEFRFTSHCLYDYFHSMYHPQQIQSRLQFSPSFQACFDRVVCAEKGTILVVPHIANFNLIGHILALRGMKFQVLSAPAIPGGYRVQNQLRSRVGLVVTPASMNAVREADRRLKSGGAVLFGADRPLPGSRYSPRFFGLPAALPVAHVRLALKHDLPVYVLGACRSPDGNYQLWASEALQMKKSANQDASILENAEMVLKSIEENIHTYPIQWNMTYPVWPEVFARMP
jgi:phosphatidylinositol dimannoside acyltransferase